MSDANTPPVAEPDFADLGPATLVAIRTGLRACDDALNIYTAIDSHRELTAAEKLDRAQWLSAREKILTQPYSLPYNPGREHRRHDSGEPPPAG